MNSILTYAIGKIESLIGQAESKGGSMASRSCVPPPSWSP